MAAQSASAADPDPALLARGLAMADATPDLRTLIISHRGLRVAGRSWHGASLTRPTNIKSASKTIVAVLTGIAAARGLFSLDDRIVPILGRLVPQDADPRVAQITIRHLLGMRAGLQGTSGANYGRWVSSRNWLGFALSRPFVDEPGGQMVYSTGNSHILGVILAHTSGQTLRELAQAWLGKPLGFTVPEWSRDPQGYYFGGKRHGDRAPTPCWRFGECCRNMGPPRRSRGHPAGLPGAGVDTCRSVPHSAVSSMAWVGGSVSPQASRWCFAWGLRRPDGVSTAPGLS